MTDNNDLKGIAGWLILVGIGVVLSPLRLLVNLIPTYKPIFEDGVWEALTTAGSDAYVPYFSSLLIGEMAYNVAMLLATIYLVFLFFTKHHFFPQLFIIIILASLIFIPLDAWFVQVLFPTEPMFDQETTKEFIRSLVVGVIWIPYMLISKRVKATFVEK